MKVSLVQLLHPKVVDNLLEAFWREVEEDSAAAVLTCMLIESCCTIVISSWTIFRMSATIAAKLHGQA